MLTKITFNSVDFKKSTPKVQSTYSSSPISANYGLGLKADTISFTSATYGNQTKIAPEKAVEVADKLTSSTSGYRAKWGSNDFNEDIVELITQGASAYMSQKGQKEILIGGDTRVGTKESMKLIKENLVKNGYKVEDAGITTTPAMAIASRAKGQPLAILMSPSHNPWADAGYNFMTQDGTIAPVNVTGAIGQNMKDFNSKKLVTGSGVDGSVKSVDIYPIYREAIEDKIDWNAIKNAGISIGYDAFEGTGQYFMPRLLSDHGINLKYNLNTEVSGPEPNEKNLQTLSEKIKSDDAKLKIGISSDGDSDRFGILDEKGNYIKPDDVILLIAYYQQKYKGMDEGYVIRSLATSSMLDVFAKKNGLDVIETPVGFKYIGEEILKLENEGKSVLVAGEESGGLTVGNHVAEKDGLLANLMIIDLVAKENRNIGEILASIKEDLGVYMGKTRFDYKFDSAPNADEAKNKFTSIFENMFIFEDGKVVGLTQDEFAGLKIDVDKTVETANNIRHFKKDGDGAKFCFENGSSMTVRKSGTEPIAKVYFETLGKSPEEEGQIMKQLQTEISSIAESNYATRK